MYPNPTVNTIGKTISMLKNIKWADLLDGTQKTLNVINQAIPIVYQIKPLANNAKTLFKIANIINTPSNVNSSTTQEKKTIQNSPIFYI